jgi:hypothetical protein
MPFLEVAASFFIKKVDKTKIVAYNHKRDVVFLGRKMKPVSFCKE